VLRRYGLFDFKPWIDELTHAESER